MIVRFTDTASARSKYRVVAYSPVVSSWEQARDKCRQLGMDLVKIENSQEDNALKNLLATECSKYARIYIIKDKEWALQLRTDPPPPILMNSSWKKFFENNYFEPFSNFY